MVRCQSGMLRVVASPPTYQVIFDYDSQWRLNYVCERAKDMPQLIKGLYICYMNILYITAKRKIKRDAYVYITHIIWTEVRTNKTFRCAI